MKNDELLKLIPLLNEAQLRTTKALVEKQLAQYKSEDEDAELILGLINEALRLHVPLSSVPQKWRNNAPLFTFFIDETFKRQRKAMRYALCKMLLGLLIDDMKAKKLPIRFGSVWIHLVRGAEVFDNQFPGYRESGLCGVILKAMEAK